MAEITHFGDLAAALDRSLPVPLGVQLKGLIEYGIACGELAPGTRLPSVRELAEAGDIAPMTAMAVYKDLQASGMVVARPGSGTFVAEGARAWPEDALGRVQTHLDAAFGVADAAGMSPADVASLLGARIGRSRARESRIVRVIMLGVFEAATSAYAREIARQLRPGDAISAVTFAHARSHPAGLPPADLYVTLANRRAEAEVLVQGRAPVTSVSFMPSEQTRARLAGIDPLARLGLVTVFPEFLALMKPGVMRFAPHVKAISAIVADDPGLAAFLRNVDALVYATGAQDALKHLAAGMPAIEYRHVPDPHAVQGVLLPLIETIRAGAAARAPESEETS